MSRKHRISAPFERKERAVEEVMSLRVSPKTEPRRRRFLADDHLTKRFGYETQAVFGEANCGCSEATRKQCGDLSATEVPELTQLRKENVKLKIYSQTIPSPSASRMNA